ncbi:hypothetical protein [Paracandidimonas lactea]|uniref:hypothetical protein n=1 Tax=Paracandidimonas lactea TaxID=2895524 RepID=UPI001F461013|nr:hypothetical protein [Paracandidimonas lactea]
MAAVEFFTGFNYKWAQDGTAFAWDEAQYKQGWATIGSVPPSVEQFNRAQQFLDEKANYLFAHIKQAATDASLTMTASDTTTLSKVIRALSLPIYATAPAVNSGPIIFALDRQQILLWQTIGTFTGYASAEVGDFHWGTSISPKPYQELLIGQNVDRTLPKYAALIAWAEANGHMKASASWVKGAFHFSDMGANLIRLPDLRDQFIRATGTDADTANARELGSKQTGAIGTHGHQINQDVRSVGLASLATGTALQLLDVEPGITQQIYATSTGGAETRGPNVALHPTIVL